MTPPDSRIADTAPTDAEVTEYDERHMILYLRLLDADAEGADWTAVARLVLGRTVASDRDGAYRCWETHLARARWMAARCYDRMRGCAKPDG
jgi:hypothetical protein